MSAPASKEHREIQASTQQRKEFTCFPNLPPELRLKIFEFALPRGHNGKIFLPVFAYDRTQLVFEITKSQKVGRNVYSNRMSRDFFQTGLAATNTESREVWKSAFPCELPHLQQGVSIPYNPSNTYVHIDDIEIFLNDPPSKKFHVENGTFLSGQTSKSTLSHSQWQNDIEHLAITHVWVGRRETHEIAEALSQFPKLKTVTCVGHLGWDHLIESRTSHAAKSQYILRLEGLARELRALIRTSGMDRPAAYEALDVLYMDAFGEMLHEARLRLKIHSGSNGNSA